MVSGIRNCKEREEEMCIMGESTQVMRASEKMKLEGEERWRKKIYMGEDG